MIANLIFLVLCTSTCIIDIHLLLIHLIDSFTPVHIHFNSNNICAKLLVWFNDGNVVYGQNPFHIVLLSVSFAVLSLFIVPFTSLGLFGVEMLRSCFITKCFVHFLMLFMDITKTIYNTGLVYV